MKKFLFIFVVFLAWMLSLPIVAMDGRGRGRGASLSSSQPGRGSGNYSGLEKQKVDQSGRGGTRGRGVVAGPSQRGGGSLQYEQRGSNSSGILTPSKVLSQPSLHLSSDSMHSIHPSQSSSSMSCPSSSSTSFPATSFDFPPPPSSSSSHQVDSFSSCPSMLSDSHQAVSTCPLNMPLHSQEWSAFSSASDTKLSGQLDQLTLSEQGDFSCLSRFPASESFPPISSSSKMSHLSSDKSLEDEDSCQDLDDDIFFKKTGFNVVFKSAQEKLSILNCSDFHFCDFMKKAAGLMVSPEEVSLIRCYGFGLGHVPLLLVWSGHLHDRLTKSKTYCVKTNDLIDILSLILIVDLQAQVDAVCIEKLKKNLKSGGSFAVDVHGPVFEQSKTAPDAARYLKSKLFALWESIIADLYGKKKLPKYKTILDRVEKITQCWKFENRPSSLWVCCPQTARGMTVANWWGAWPSDRFGNWWDPQKELIEACRIFEEEHYYNDVIQQKISIVLREFSSHQSWLGYFGDLCSLEDIRGEEYDSDGGF